MIKRHCSARIFRIKGNEVFVVSDDGTVPALRWDRLLCQFVQVLNTLTEGATRVPSHPPSSLESERIPPLLDPTSRYGCNGSHSTADEPQSAEAGPEVCRTNAAWTRLKRLLSAPEGTDAAAGDSSTDTPPKGCRSALRGEETGVLPNAETKEKSPTEASGSDSSYSDDEEGEGSGDEDFVLETIPCVALYGVLPISKTCHLLLYVTDAVEVARLPPSGHVVYGVRRLAFLRLPEIGHAEAARSDPSVGEDDSSDARTRRRDNTEAGRAERSLRGRGPISGLSRGHLSAESSAPTLSEATIQEYCEVVRRFCSSGGHDGCAYFFFSTTVNLALNYGCTFDGSAPNSMSNHQGSSAAATSSTSFPMPGGGTPADSAGGCDYLESSDCSPFQWNYPLTAAFSMVEDGPLCCRDDTPPFSTFQAGQTSGGGSADRHSVGGASLPLPPTPTRAAVSSLCDCYVPAFIRGVVEQKTVPLVRESSGYAAEHVNVALITRLCRQWAGTRYNRRGLDAINDSGIPANFALTSLLLWTVRVCPQCGDGESMWLRAAQYTILRGSIPRRWSQPANLTFKPVITISGDGVAGSADAGEELLSHVKRLRSIFPNMTGLHCIDTTSLSKLEKPLSDAFRTAFDCVVGDEELRRELPEGFSLVYTKYNVKAKFRVCPSYDAMKDDLLSGLAGGGEDEAPEPQTVPHIDYFQFDRWTTLEASDAVGSDCTSTSDPLGATCCTSSRAPARHLRQGEQGAFFRVNCLDCLDRTNVVQSMITLTVVPHMLRYVLGQDQSTQPTEATVAPAPWVFRDVERICRQLWATNGVALSRLYAGSEPHFLPFLLTGKKGVLSGLSEGHIALRRWVQQNFFDGKKQDSVALLTGQHNPEPLHATTESPFTRRLSGLNRMVHLGIVVALLAFLINGALMLLVPAYRFRKELLFFEALWIMYLSSLMTRIMKDAHSYTDYPLLK